MYAAAAALAAGLFQIRLCNDDPVVDIAQEAVFVLFFQRYTAWMAQAAN